MTLTTLTLTLTYSSTVTTSSHTIDSSTIATLVKEYEAMYRALSLTYSYTVPLPIPLPLPSYLSSIAIILYRNISERIRGDVSRPLPHLLLR